MPRVNASQMITFKPLLRISVGGSAAFLACVFAVSAASARVPAVYIGSSACASCGVVPLSEHPRRLVVTPDCEIHSIRWRHWGAHRTTGRGTFLCGTGVSEPRARLVASDPVRCGRHVVYSRLAWATPTSITPAGKPFMTAVPFEKGRCEFAP